jgi:two-component system CheB/CheR fusion protein
VCAGDVPPERDVCVRNPHPRTGGPGLGWTQVKGRTEWRGRTVEAHSAGPGRGEGLVTRSASTEEPAALAETETAPRPAGERLRVLIVEDNCDAADSLRMLLEIIGHDVRVAYNGPDGVAEARRWQPGVVLCDIGLPGLDGYGVAEALRRDPATAGARLIAITGYGSEEDRRRALATGFDYHLTKPADPVLLQDLLTGPPPKSPA